MHRSMSFILAASSLVLLTGCHPAASSNREAMAQQAARAPADRVTAGNPTRQTLTLYTTQPGHVEAFEETPLFPKLAGFVDQVHVDIGDRVEKGQVLITLSIPELLDERRRKEALVAQARAEVEQSRAAVEAARAAAASAEAKISEAEAGIGRAQGELERSRSEYQRVKELADKGSLTAKLADETLHQLRSAEAMVLEAKAHVDSAKAAANEARANAVKAEADLEAARAKERVAQAELALAETMVAYTVIRAPFDGVISHRGVDTGAYVQPAASNASTPLLTVVRTNKVRAFVDVPEMEAAFVDAGDRADTAVVRVQALQDREFKAQVARTSWSLDAGNRSLRTAIDIDNEDGALRPGMYAAVTILLEQRERVIALPISAIARDGRKTYCCCVEGGKIVYKPVELGLRVADTVEIRAGIQESDLVVTARVDGLQEGQTVEVMQDEK